MQKHSCGASTFLEAFLFDTLYSSIDSTKDFVPDDECCICLKSLKHDAPKETGCCGRYASKTNCGHWMHVSCLISCPTKTNCPICQTNLIDDEWMKIKSQRSKIYKLIPDDYKNMYLKKGIEIFLDQDVINDLTKRNVNAQYIYSQLQPWHNFLKKNQGK